ncbi:arsenite-activated ATPase ArsA [Candidatus Magnetomorum sp. HK-1]|nr:arsenite-activated ATPase ArsA [Candidatus Magnetomorum sp. HK-1]
MKTPSFFNNPDLKLLFLGGKGGVGKTSCATSSALTLSMKFKEKSFLLVSTDPAHSVKDSLNMELFPENLTVIELDANKSLDDFMKSHQEKLKQIALRGTFLDDDDITKFLDLSLPGMDELMAFLEITRWVDKKIYDTIIIDTAPTGHTLRLLTMPDLLKKWLEAIDTLLAKHRYMKKVMKGSYKKDELDHFVLGLAKDVKEAESLLKNSNRCLFVPVMLAEDLSVQETRRLVKKLSEIKIPVNDIIINKLYPENTCTVCQKRRDVQFRFLQTIKEIFRSYKLWGIPRYPIDITGQESLQQIWSNLIDIQTFSPESHNQQFEFKIPNTATYIPKSETFHPNKQKFYLFSGKGGVGKTTLACATALYLSKKNNVFLFSTDPAHSLSDCLGKDIGDKPVHITRKLDAMEINASEEFDRLKNEYQSELKKFLESISKSFDLSFDREVMERIMDLSPPGIDEIMALTKMMDFFSDDKYDIFILDSAPTGHLIRLLEMPQIMDQWLKTFFTLFIKYKNIFRLPKVSQLMVKLSKQLKVLRNLLTDDKKSAVYCVSQLTQMSYEETKDLVASCKGLNIPIPKIFLNLATPQNDCDFCSRLNQREQSIQKEFQNYFPNIHQSIVYYQGVLDNLQKLEGLGDSLFQ